MTHLTFDEISELAEAGEPLSASNRDALTHVASCAACRETLERVRAVVGAAHNLPREISPPPDGWQSLRARLRAERRNIAPSIWRQPWLAVAAVLVIAVMGVVALSLRGSNAGTNDARVAVAPAAVASPVVQAVDRNYTGTIDDLRATLASQRAKLAPSTVRTVDRALTVIDSAIAEARAALAADPANPALIDILSARYERKLDLLQRATQLSSL